MRLLNKFLLTLLLIFCLLIAAAFYISVNYGEEIKSFVVENLNKNLKTEVQVEAVDFSLWENFPRASIVFKNLVIHSVDAKNDTLLSAGKLSTQFSLADLYYGRYKLIGLEISDGSCTMIVDNNGRSNYIFWNENDTNQNTFSIDLNQVTLKNIKFDYLDYRKKIGVSFLIEETSLKGNFKKSVFETEIKTQLKKANIQIGEMNLFENRDLYLFVSGNVNQDKKQLTFDDSNLGIDDMNLALTGSVGYGDISLLDITIGSNNADLKKALALLPKTIRNKIDRFDIKGKANFNGRINGEISEKSIPSYSFNFSITDGYFKDKNSELNFTNSSLDGTITNGASRNLSSTELNLKSFESNLKDGSLKGTLHIKNFNKPKYSYSGTVGFDLNELKDLAQWKDLSKTEGNIDATLDLTGTLQEVGKYDLKDWKNSRIGGKIKLSDIGFFYQDRPQHFSSINADLNFNNNTIEVNNLSGNIDNTSLDLSGKFNNLIGFLLEENEPLFIDARLASPKVELDNLLKSKKTGNNTTNEFSLDISPRITVYLDTKVDSLVFKQFGLSQLSSSFIIKDQRIDARNLVFQSQEGNFSGDLFIRETNNGKLNFYSQVDLSRVNINRLFKSFNNFGQNTLIADHISGIADATIKYNSTWSKQLEIDPKTIEIEADLVINNGVLQDFEPLEALSKFVELEELKRIEFKQIKNQILIKNEVITLPRFNLFSSAIDLTIAGTHTFDNAIDYHFKLLLSQIIGRKAKKPVNNEFGFIEDDGLGKSKLFLKMTGTVENPEIAYDSKELKNTLKAKIEEEKQTFKSILKEEFGVFKKDTAIKYKSQPKRSSPFEVEVDSSFIKKKEKQATKYEQGDKNAKNSNEETKKSKFGNFLDKIAKPNEEEYVKPIEN